MERPHTPPQTELPPPVDPDLEQYQNNTAEIMVPENELAAEALAKQPGISPESREKLEQDNEEPFEMLLERKHEVLDEAAASSPMVSIGEVVETLPNRQPQIAAATDKAASSSGDTPWKTTMVRDFQLSALWTTPLYRQAVIKGFIVALVSLVVLAVVTQLT